MGFAALFALVSTCVSAQSLLILSQTGSVSASASVSGPAGAKSDYELTPMPPPGPVSIFAGAGASLPEMFASATSGLDISLTSQRLTLTAAQDGNGSVGNTEEQSAGGSGYVNLTLKFTVDAPALFTLTGWTDGVWTGDASSDMGFWLESTTEYLTDSIGPGLQVEYEGVLLPGETYTLTAYGIASAVTAFGSEFGFSSAQGAFAATVTLTGPAAVPEPGSVLFLTLIGPVALLCLLRGRLTRNGEPQ